MTLSTPIRIAAGCIIAAACLWLAFSTRSCVGTHRAAAAVQKADEHHEAATASAAQGAAHDQEASAQTPQIQNDAAEVAHLRAALARVRQGVPVAPAPPPGHDSAPDPEPAK